MAISRENARVDSTRRDRRSSVSNARRPGPPRRESSCWYRRMQRAVRKAEHANAGGTGATILRFRAAPLTRLIERKRIGHEEVRAAEEIAMAFHAQAAEVMLKPPPLEKRDAPYPGSESLRVIEAVARYKPWARHWSQRARRGDRTLEIIVAAVIDERGFQVIETDTGLRHGLAARVVVAALRHYAARAGWIDRRTGDAWIREAEKIFPLREQVDL